MRTDLGPDELAAYCRRVLEAASEVKDLDGVTRLMLVVLNGLGYPSQAQDRRQSTVTRNHRPPH